MGTEQSESVLTPLVDANVADRAAEKLRQAIFEGRYPPGARLVERKLAAELGISHIPVREALARLADEGLVERLPRRGCRVAALTVDELLEISSVRTVLEQLVATRVQQHWTPRVEAELRTVVAEMVTAARRGDVRAVFDIDGRLHERLWRLSEHGVLIELVSQLRGRIHGFLRAAIVALEPEDLEQHAILHGVLLDALASGDPERAQRVMASHIEMAASRISAGLEPSESDERADG
jgi:DNA-binding GntR family transcriptional regulator